MRYRASLACLWSCSACFAPAAADPIDGFEGFVTAAMAEWRVPGLAIGVIRGGELIYSRGFGVRDLHSGGAVTPATLFPIAGCSQPFTSLLLQLLAEAGAIDLDAPVRDVLPSFTTADDYVTAHATPRDLLCHRTGIGSFAADLDEPTLSRPATLELLSGRPLERPFRYGFHDSDLSAVIAELVAAAAAGGSWERALRSRVLEPLGMTRTAVGGVDLPADAVTLHVENDGVVAPIDRRRGPRGQIDSNVEDLARWLGSYLPSATTSLLPPEAVEAAYWPLVPVHWARRDEFSHTGYGLGWGVEWYRGHLHARLGGFGRGCEGLVAWFPRDDIGFVLLANKGGVISLLTYLEFYLFDRLLEVRNPDGSYTDWPGRARERLARLRS